MENPTEPIDNQENALDKEISNTMGFSEFMSTQANRPRPDFPPNHRGNRGGYNGNGRGGNRGRRYYNRWNNRDYNGGPRVNSQGPLTAMTDSTANSASGPPSTPNPNTQPDANTDANGNGTNNKTRGRKGKRYYQRKNKSKENNTQPKEAVQDTDKTANPSPSANLNAKDDGEVRGIEGDTDATQQPKVAVATDDEDKNGDTGQGVAIASKVDEGINNETEAGTQAEDKKAREVVAEEGIAKADTPSKEEAGESGEMDKAKDVEEDSTKEDGEKEKTGDEIMIEEKVGEAEKEVTVEETTKDEIAEVETVKDDDVADEEPVIEEAQDDESKAQPDADNNDKLQGEIEPAEAQTNTHHETGAETDIQAGEKVKVEGERPKRTNYFDTEGKFHCPNGDILSHRELGDLSSGVRLENGDTEYFKPSFINENPWKDLLPVPIARTPYRLFYDADD